MDSRLLSKLFYTFISDRDAATVVVRDLLMLESQTEAYFHRRVSAVKSCWCCLLTHELQSVGSADGNSKMIMFSSQNVNSLADISHFHHQGEVLDSFCCVGFLFS